MAQKSITVIGSLNFDFVTRTPRFPEAGETLAASSFDSGFGGKGANQAVACARLVPDDVKVRMVGNVGDDVFGQDYLAGLEKEGIDVSTVNKLAGQKTGIANIIVDEVSGDNRILITANANYAFSKEPSHAWNLVPEVADIVVFQLEIPLQVVLHNMHLACESGKHVILNPAPATLLPDFAYQDIDTLILNETEAEILAGPKYQDEAHGKLSADDMHTMFQMTSIFMQCGVKEAVIITLGSKGLVYRTRSGRSGYMGAKKVEAVDTTAAGDTFVGAYAVRRARYDNSSFDIETALEFATTAAAKSVLTPGAMASIPYLHDISVGLQAKDAPGDAFTKVVLQPPRRARISL